MNSPAIQQIGRYEIRGVLGRGAMGVVYRAYDTVLERTVALKTHHSNLGEDDGLRRRFASEVKTSSRLNHTNIVTVFDGGIETDVPFIAMELVDGTTLQEVLAERGKLPTNEAVSILVPVGEALAYAHRQQIIHRDLKPANILIAAGGQAKVSDFGIAKALDSTAPNTTMLVGTPSHMAPEQIEGGPIDGRVDVFALGVVAYETLTGKAPFGGSQLAQIIHSVMTVEPTPPSDVEGSLPKAVDSVIAHALAKDPSARYADAETFVHDLRDALESRPAAPTIVLPKEAAAALAAGGRPRSRLPQWVMASSAACVAAAAVIYFVAFAPRSEPPSWVEAKARTSLPPAIEAPAQPPAVSVPESAPATAPEAMVPPSVPSEPSNSEAPQDAKAAPNVAPEPPPAPQAENRAENRAEDRADHAEPPASSPIAEAPSVAEESKPATSAPDSRDAAPDTDAQTSRKDEEPEKPRPPRSEPRPRSVEPSSGRTKSAVASVSGRNANSLTVESEPRGASVRVNGKPRGQAPLELSGLPIGSYEVVVEFPGVPPQTRTVKLIGGSLLTLTFKLSR